MIDWVSGSLPLSWRETVSGGQVVHLHPDGSVEWATLKTLHLEGSYDSRISVRTVRHGWIEFAGNPVKWLQGHNLFGTSDFRGLMFAFAERLCEVLDIEPTVEDRTKWLIGDYELSRVDLTESFSLPSYDDVSAWIKAASEVSTVKWRGRGHYQDGTLYFGKVASGKRASRWQVKLYHKGAEVMLPGHRLPELMPYRSELEGWASNKLRVEVTLRGMELDRRGLKRGTSWNERTAGELFSHYSARVEIGDGRVVEDEVLDQLPKEAARAYQLWSDGNDIRRLYKRTAYYKYRRILLDECGIDIGSTRPKGNVVPLRRVLSAVPAELPEYAQEVMFVPPSRLRAVA